MPEIGNRAPVFYGLFLVGQDKLPFGKLAVRHGFDKKNAFDVERYMSTRPAIVKPDEAFDIYEIDLSDEDAAAEE